MKIDNMPRQRGYSDKFIIAYGSLRNFACQKRNCTEFNKRLYRQIMLVVYKDELSLKEMGIFIKKALRYSK